MVIRWCGDEVMWCGDGGARKELDAKMRAKEVVRGYWHRFWYTRREKFVVPPAANSPFLTLFYSLLQKLTTKIESFTTS